MRRTLSMGISIMLISFFALVTDVCYAADYAVYGLIDYFNTFDGIDLSGIYANQNMIIREADYTEGEFARADLTESIYDGHTLYMILELVPTDDAAFLYDIWDDTDDYMPDLIGHESINDDELTYTEYANKIGRTKLLSVDPSFEFEDTGALYSTRMYSDDGGLLYFVQVDPVEINKTVLCTITVNVSDEENAETLQLHKEFAPSGELTISQSTACVELSDIGVRIDKLTAVYSDITTYYTVEYTVTDSAAFDKAEDEYNLWFEVTKTDGNRFNGGLIAPAIYRIDEKQFRLLTTSGYSEEKFDKLIIMAFDANTKETLAETCVQIPIDM